MRKIIARVLRGDHAAFAMIVRAYEAPLRRFVRRLGAPTEDDAQDIVQETFLKAFRALASVDTRITFSAWLYRIARNTLISHYRAARARGRDVTVAWNAGDMARIESAILRADEFMMRIVRMRVPCARR